MKPSHLISFVLYALILTSQTTSQVKLDYYLPTDAMYDPAIPTPESFFGFQVGKWHLRPDQIDSYLQLLAKSSPRVTIEKYGETYEKRPLYMLTITSIDNQKNSDSIKKKHKSLSDPSVSSSLDISPMPLVTWMGYSVHGNEPSGSNATPLVAYYLAAARGEEIDRILDETIILMVPMINPDGLNRFAHWVNMHKGKNLVSDPNSREHQEPWPSGRFNHYWFDLNRDWMPLQHPESRSRMAKYYEWMPNILTDHHEMGTNSTFFFQPGIPTRNNPLTPKRNHELTEMIARFHARELDRAGSYYYSKESFDDFYIGKGSSYPDMTGCIGILFEQASSRGHLQESIHGDLSFPFTIRNQVLTSLSTLKAGVTLRKELLSHQRDFFASGLKQGGASPIKAYLFGSGTDPDRNTHFLHILRRHQILVHELAQPLKADGNTFNPGRAYIVPTNQPQFRLVTSLFERRSDFEDSLFYDISAWTLPYAFNLPFAELKEVSRDLIGKSVAFPQFPKGSRVGGKADYAYAMEWKNYHAPRALYRLLKAGISVKVASTPFESSTSEGKRRFDYGTILIHNGNKKESSVALEPLLDKIIEEDGVTIVALQTGLSVSGIDLGSPHFETLQKPNVMIIVGQGVSPTDAGEAWHLLDEQFDMEVSLVESGAIGRTDLTRYTTIVMVDGNYGGIDSTGKLVLRQWVENGGTLVAMENAVEWNVNNKFALAKLRKDDPAGDSIAIRRPYEMAGIDRGARAIGGAIFEVTFDRTHPLLYGYEGSRMSVFRGNSVFLDPSKNPYATPVVYTANPLLSGYLNRVHQKSIKNSASVLVSGLKNGRVILMTDNPNFRSFWFGTSRMFLNCIFFGSTIRQNTIRAEEE